MVQTTTSDAAAGALVIEPGHRLDLRAFEDVLPLLSKDVELMFGRRTRLAPLSVKERPYSHVMRVGIWHDGDSGPREHLFVKVSKHKEVDGSPNGMRLRVEKDFAVTERVHARMLRGAVYGAVRPVACYPAHLAIVTEEVPGKTLLDVLQRDLRWDFSGARADRFAASMTAIGQWIREFQEPSAETMTNAWVEDYIDHRLKKIAAASRPGEQLRYRVLRHVRHVVDRLGDQAIGKVTVHADLSPSNIMMSNGRIVVLDFAMARLGHPLQDVSRMFSQLELMAVKPQYRLLSIRILQKALLRGFDPAIDAGDPAFRLQLLVQRVNHLASMCTRRYAGVEALYNGFVRRRHWTWIERETAPGGGVSASWG